MPNQIIVKRYRCVLKTDSGSKEEFVYGTKESIKEHLAMMINHCLMIEDNRGTKFELLPNDMKDIDEERFGTNIVQEDLPQYHFRHGWAEVYAYEDNWGLDLFPLCNKKKNIGGIKNGCYHQSNHE